MYKVCLIGLGNQGFLADCEGSGNEHKTISYAKAFNENYNFIVSAVVDKDENKINKYTDYYSNNYLVCYENIDIALQTDYYDVIIIATNDETHFDILSDVVKYSIGHNPKLVICEKPLCMNSKEADLIDAIYELHNIPILVNYTRRFIPELIKLKNDYKNGKFGNIIRVDSSFNRGNFHTGTHLVDFLLWFFENELKDFKINVLNNVLDTVEYRVWNIQLYFEKYYWQEQRIFDMDVPKYYDNSMKYLVDNVFNFLKAKEKLKCTSKNAIDSLKFIEKYLYERQKI